jgi:hypothetical protein
MLLMYNTMSQAPVKGASINVEGKIFLIT